MMKSFIKTALLKIVDLALILTIVFLINVQVYGQTSNPNNSLLWKIEGNGLQKPSYLFGTNHMLCEGDYVIPQKIKDALAQTEQSYLEINLDDPNFAVEAQKHMKSDQSLTSLISKEDYNYIDSLLKVKLKTNLKQLESIKPMLVVSSLMQTAIPCKLVSFESEIIKINKAANKEIHGLSSIAEQYSFLDKIFKPKDFVPFLKMWSEEEMKKSFKELKEAYLKEDLTTIDKLMAAFYTADPDGYHQLLPVRNHLWADRMPNILKGKPTFFAIGCGHLQGKEGVIALLKAKGYTVTPVK